MRHITVPLINYNLIGNANNSVEIRGIECFQKIALAAVKADLAMLRDAVKVQVLYSTQNGLGIYTRKHLCRYDLAFSVL